MKNHISIALILLASTIRAEIISLSTGPLTLDVCYRLALARSESVGISEEDIRRGEFQYAQLRSGILPAVGFRVTEKIEDVSGVPSGANDKVSRRDRAEAALYGRQALFSGFREFAAMKGQKAEISARREAVDRAKILLYEDVSGLFFSVVDRDREMENLQTLIGLSGDRVLELKKRVAIGRSRESEILSTESQSAILESRWEVARGFQEATLGVLNTLLGVQAAALLDDRPEATVPEPLENYLARLSRRADVREAEARAEARRHFTDSSRRGHFPTLDLSGNYYLKRTGSDKPVNWDVFFTLDAPVFAGGKTESLVGQSQSDERTAALRASQVRREAEGEVRERYRNLSSLLSQVEKLKRSAELARKNADVQRNEYRLGLVNNLDVLTAMNTWQETQRALDTARLEAKNAAIRLELSVGNLPGGNP